VPRCGWAPPGPAGSVASWWERVPSTPGARARRRRPRAPAAPAQSNPGGGSAGAVAPWGRAC